MASTMNLSSGSPLDARELQIKLEAALARTKDLQRQKEDLDQRLTETKKELQEANIGLEFSRSEVTNYEGYYTKWTTAEQERDEARRERDEARQQRDEARQQRDEARQELREAQTSHADTLGEQKKKEEKLLDTLKGMGTKKREDWLKLKAQKVEITELKRQRLAHYTGGVGASATVKDSSQENLNGADNDDADVKEVLEKVLKRNHNEAFPEGDADSPRRLPLSQSSQHNSPTSQRISKRPNTHREARPESPLPVERIRGPPVSRPSRILAESSQPESMDQETEETVPLDFGHPGDLDNAKDNQGFAINLHDKTKSKPLVSPESETAPEVHRRRMEDYLGVEVKDVNKPIVKHEEGATAGNAKTTEKGLNTPSTDQILRNRTKNDQSIKMDSSVSVKRETSVSRPERPVKQETPIRSEAASRGTTPATGSVDKRKLLPIPGWKGGRSSRALTRRDSFEDDDGFGYRAPAEGPSTKKMRSTPAQGKISGTRVESPAVDTPVPGQKTARMGKHAAIPAHMTTEMTRSRTTGSAALGDRGSPLRGRGGTSGIRSDPVDEREMTPLADKNRNVRRGSEVPGDALKRERAGEGKVSRRGKELECGGESKDQVGSSKGNKAKQEEFEINPERNHGLNYAYQNVERRKEERKKLTGHGCIECENYYNAVGEMPVISRAPIWRVPSPGSKRREARAGFGKCPHGKVVDEDGSVSGEEDEGEGKEDVKQALKNKISRHREDWTAPSTPPMYWNIGFPSTQDVEEINAQAEQQRESKRAEMQREAEKKDGRYRRVGK